MLPIIASQAGKTIPPLLVLSSKFRVKDETHLREKIARKMEEEGREITVEPPAKLET